MSTVRDLIIDALQEIGIVGADRDLDPDIGVVGLRQLLRMRDRFMAERLFLYTVDRQTFALTAGQQTRTIGAGGNFATPNRPRPLFISSVMTIPVGDTLEYEVTRYRTRDEWLREPLKSLTDAWPRKYWYEPTDTLGTFSFWPIPTTAASIVLGAPLPLQVLPADPEAALDTELTFAEGYEDAWVLNLAKRLQGPMEVPASQSLQEEARMALAVIKRLNDGGPPASRSDAAITGHGLFDIMSNQFRT